MRSSRERRRPRGVVLAALSLAACAEILGGEDYYVDPGPNTTPLPEGGGMDVATGGAGADFDSGPGASMDAQPPCESYLECPPPSRPCRVVRCERQQCVEDLAPVRSECHANGGTQCNADGECVACLVDGFLSPGETDVDCGGPSCPPCTEGKGCDRGQDCTSGVCHGTLFVCLRSDCNDGRWNPDTETSTDCGGECDGCEQGDDCETDADCLSGFCEDGVCCGVRCDGVCERCEPGTGACRFIPNDSDPDDECPGEVNFCDGAGVCQYCKNGLLDPGETDQDCGGAVCAPCEVGDACERGSDCASCLCEGNVCVAPKCGNGEKDGCESDRDCGGPCGATCPVGAACRVKADCATFNCVEGRCAE